MRYEFLPPYSPDFNPIELSFSAMKARLRRWAAEVWEAMGEDDDSDVYMILAKAVYDASESDIEGWFRHCGLLE